MKLITLALAAASLAAAQIPDQPKCCENYAYPVQAACPGGVVCCDPGSNGNDCGDYNGPYNGYFEIQAFIDPSSVPVDPRVCGRGPYGGGHGLFYCGAR
ncbi:unnamed protein product [Zymoseptoria tritici ST99CH_1A5]|uniref:Hydrophobin n=2 Tax=Zymoseptoria tritici TaxID=1047171 RepID=A0A1X7S035_ZYMT9|nr:unnamed protein product [Zymoseptoria tritici ST99CH_3D7]SMY26625.1 unnamed protein product [Zymoseptoria tritici ST99CH_1A5]